MPTPKGYEQLVEGFREKIRGNVSSVKMTPSETAKEIADITGNVFAEGATISGASELPDGTKITIEPQPIYQPKRRGRPKGSRNKPKI